MDKGIRPAVNAKFLELLPKRAELGNTGFRKSVMGYAMEEFSITLASAATHYNHSFQKVKAETPALVEGLGRADDKKGGRKPKPKAAPAAATTEAQSLTAADIGDLNSVLNGAAPQLGTGAAAEDAPVVPAAVAAPDAPAITDPNAAEDAGETGEEQKLFVLKKIKDGSVVAADVTFEQARDAIAKAKAQSKAKLYMA